VKPKSSCVCVCVCVCVLSTVYLELQVGEPGGQGVDVIVGEVKRSDIP
jgi:hypothetical protein